MNLFQRLKIWKELKRLENRARDEPCPSTFVDLGQVYINLGMSDRTLQVSEEGLALFPDSEELRKLHKFALKSHRTVRINDLRDRLNRSPDPELYRELSNLYLESGDFGAVQGLCEECLRRFPDDSGSLLVLARARLTNFYRDLSAREGLEAVRCLQKVVSLEADNTKAHRLLLDVFYRVGATVPAMQHLEVLESATPNDSELSAMRQQLAGQESAGADVEVLFHNVESKGRLANVPVSRQRSAAPKSTTESMARIRDALATIAEQPGVRKAAYIAGSKALVKGEIRSGKDGFLRAVRMITKASQRFARRLDIGSFNKGSMVGEFGHICMCSFGEVVAAVQCDDGVAVDQVLSELQELVAGSLFLSAEAAK